MNTDFSLLRLGSFVSLVLAAGLLLNSCASPTAEKPAAPPPPPEAAKPEAAPAEAPKPEAPKPEAVAPEAPKPAAPAEAEAAKPAPPAPVAGSSTEHFDFDRALLRPSEKEKLDREVVDRLATFSDIEYINVNGYADRLGTARYNQKLSERRAAAAKAYLVSHGVDGSKIETRGFGKTVQVKSCPDIKKRKALIECLAPNRRVVVDIKGTPKL